MAKLINGNGNPAIYAAEDADLIASLAGNVTCIANVGNKYAATEEDATTIRLDDGVIITKEGRRIQLEAGESDTFYIPTGTSGQTNYYIIGYKLVQNADSTQVAEQFVQKMNSSSETITEDTFRSGATEVYVSVYRVTQVGFTIDSISGLLPELLDNASINEDIDQINSDLVNKQDKIETIVPLADDYNLDTLLSVGVYTCYCTIWGARARYIIKNIAIRGSAHNYYRQIAVPYMGNDSYVFIRYTRYDNNNNIVWTGWTPIDAFQYLQNKITNVENSITSINNSITALNQKFTNTVNEGQVSNCNQAPDGVSFVIDTTSNKPNGTNYGVLVQFTTGNGNNPSKVQFLSEYATNKLYVRNYFNASWMNWLEK